MPRYQIDARGQRVEPGDAGYDWNAGSESFDPVADARAYLDRQTGPQMPGVTSVEGDPSMAAPAPSRQGTLRGFTEMLAKPSAALGTAALGSTLTGIGAPAAPFLMAGAGLSAAPDIARRLLSPDEDESRGWAAGEAGLQALAPGLRMGKGAFQSLSALSRAAKPAGWAGKSTASAYGGVGRNVSNFDDVAKETAQELPESWKQFVRPEGFRGKAEAAAPYARPDRSLSSKLAESLRQGGSGLDETAFASSGRNLNTSDNPLLDLLPDGSEMMQPEYGPNLMDNFRRLAIPARSRAFRNNTPFPE